MTHKGSQRHAEDRAAVLLLCYHSATKPPRTGAYKDQQRLLRLVGSSPIRRPAKADGREPVGAVAVG